MALPTHLTILSVPFEATTSFLKGTGKAPKALLEALNSSGDLTFKVIETCSPDDQDPQLMESSVHNATRETLLSGGFPLAFGGEHTISIGAIRAASSVSHVGVVQLDAHADLRDQYEGTKWSHACAMRRSVEKGIPLLGIGIRAMCEEEAKYVKSRDDINLVDGRTARFSTDWYGLLDDLPDNIYLTIDMDAFDPTEVPAVGTPEPGGMTYNSVCSFLKHLFKHKNVIAADINELRPCEGDESSIRLTASLFELIYQLRFGPLFLDGSGVSDI